MSALTEVEIFSCLTENFRLAGRRHFSLRSPEDGADVGAVAKRVVENFNLFATWKVDWRDWHGGRDFVGGGHVHAAGFDAPLGWEGE